MEPASILILFIVFRLIREGLETMLSLANYLYTRDPINQKQAVKALEIEPDDLQKTIAYSEAKFRFGMFSGWFSLIVFLVFLYLGGFGLVEGWAKALATGWGFSAIVTGLLFFGILSLLSGIIGLPFDLYSTFVIEEKFGFNKQTIGRFFVDKIKGLLLGALLGGGILALLLWIMQETGPLWWLYGWIALTVFSVLTAWLYPVLLAPLFNKFTPLEDGELKSGIDALARRVGFNAGEVFVMNASIRSSHGNAYFTGMFGKKRIVLFDTLIESMSPKEVVAVLAHELGHFKLNHVRWMILRGIMMTGVIFYLLSLALPYESFYLAFHFQGSSHYAALITFSLWYGLVDFFIQPFLTYLSRKNEFAADAFAKSSLEGNPNDLATALLKLRKKSSSLPLYHPLYSAIYHSHPPMIERLTALGYLNSSDSKLAPNN